MASVSASWARWPPDSVPGPLAGVEPELLDPPLGQLGVPTGFEPCPHPQVVAHRHPRVESACPGRRSPPVRAGSRRRAGAAPSTSIVPAVGCEQPDGQMQQRGLAGAVRARPARRPGPPGRTACSRAAPTGGRSACRARSPRSPRSCHPSARRSSGRRCGRSPRCRRGPSPAARAERSHSFSEAQEPGLGRGVGPRQRADHERANPGPRAHQALPLEIAVGLEHGVGVDGQAGDQTC